VNKFAFFGGGTAPSAFNGFVKVGASSAPIYPLDLTGSQNNWVLNVANSHATQPFGARIRFSAAAPNNTTQEFLHCEDNVATRLTIWSNGNVVNANNSYGAISDAKLKRDIRDRRAAAGRRPRHAASQIQADRGRRRRAGADRPGRAGARAGFAQAWCSRHPTRNAYFEQAYERGGVGEPDQIPLIGVGEWKERETGTFTKGINYSVAKFEAARRRPGAARPARGASRRARPAAARPAPIGGISVMPGGGEMDVVAKLDPENPALERVGRLLRQTVPRATIELDELEARLRELGPNGGGKKP
jgi:hypothetical protein